MQYLESFQNFEPHNEIFTGIGRLAGRGIGAITNFLGGRSQATNRSDNDLAREILAYVQNMPRNYNTTGQLNYRNVNKTGNTRYMFIGNPFDTLAIENDPDLSRKEKAKKKKDVWSYTVKTDNDWRIDVLKHGDYKTTNDPEYAIYISKVNGSEVRPETPPVDPETPPVNREQSPDEDAEKETQNKKPQNTTPSDKEPQEQKDSQKFLPPSKGPQNAKPQKSSPSANQQLLLNPAGDKDDRLDVIRDMSDDQIEDLIKSNPGSADIIKRLRAESKGQNLKPSIKDSYSYQIDEQRVGRNYGGLGSGINLSGQRTRQNIDINPTFGKNQKLACTQGLAEEIWQLCYEINQATTRTNTGDARGGAASQHPFRPRY
jgi:hypothetical protein